MTLLVIGDLHLTDKARDAYRFGIFDWIKKQEQEYAPKIIFMGDITDKKDKHTSALVNRIVHEFDGLQCGFYILMGNHDYIDPQTPFFKFLGARLIHEPTQINWNQKRMLFIPHIRKESDFAAACNDFRGASLDYVFCHQTFEGAIAETGTRLSGFRHAHIDQLQPRLGVYAGDVHRPQRAANAVYVGAPYHVRFGDNFDPRCLLIDDAGHAKNLYFETVRKWSLTIRSADEILDNKQLFKGDQVVLTIELAREEAVEWKAHKQQVLDAANKKGLEVFGVDIKVNTGTVKKVKVADLKSRMPADVLAAYCKTENLPSQTKKAGEGLLNGAGSY